MTSPCETSHRGAGHTAGDAHRERDDKGPAHGPFFEAAVDLYRRGLMPLHTRAIRANLSRGRLRGMADGGSALPWNGLKRWFSAGVPKTLGFLPGYPA